MANVDTAENSSAATQRKAAAVLMGVSYALGAIGIFIGIAGRPNSFAIFCLLAVGGPTTAGFIRHVFLWRGDAQRLGFATPDPSWMWEVGFADLAIAVTAVLSVALGWGTAAQAAVVVVMGVYMVCVTVVHVASWLRKDRSERRNPVIAIVVPLAYGAMLLAVAFVNV